MQISLRQYLKTVNLPAIFVVENGIGRDVSKPGKALLDLLGTEEDEQWTYNWDGPESWASNGPTPQGISYVACSSQQ